MKMKHMRLGEHLLKFGILYLLVLLLLGTSLISDNILTSSNLINVIRQASMLIIISLGEGMVIVSSGIDLSVGSIAAYTGVFSAGAMVYWGWPIPVAIIATVLLCTIIGLLNGIIVAKAGIQPMIATLATMNAVKGMAMLYADGGQVVGLSADFTKLGRGYLLEVIPIPVVFMVVVSLIIFFVMTKTTFGKYLYAIGGSEEVARLAGINVVSTKIAAYGISSMLAAIAGVLHCARLSMGDPTIGDSFPMDAIASVVLGGISLNGGSGGILGAVVGALFITVLGNCMNIIGISSFWQLVFKAVVLIVAALIYRGENQK